MSAVLAYRPIEQADTLRLVEPTRDCPRCDGSGEVCHPRDEWKWGNDPSVRSVPCPSFACVKGQVSDENFDPAEASWYCTCNRDPADWLVLVAGESCRCGTTP